MQPQTAIVRKKTPEDDKTSPALALILHASFSGAHYVYVLLNVVSHCAVDIPHDLLALFSFGAPLLM